MIINKLTALVELINKFNELPWDYALYIPVENSDWSENMQCMVLDPEVTDNPDDDPDIAVRNNLTYAFMISDFQSIVQNAQNQKMGVELKIILDCVKYYYECDAYKNIFE